MGIVASRLIEHFYRPTIVLTRSGELVAGSARSVAGFNVYEAIHECRELLLGYGGHFYAAGMTMSPGNVVAFREKFEEVVSGSILPSSLVPGLNIDIELSLQDLTPVFYKILCQMEPFGPDNPKPLLLIRHLRDTGESRILKDQHLRFSVRDDLNAINGIGFNMAEKSSLLLSGEPVDIVFNLEENEWNGQKSLQMKVVDFVKSKIKN
ncbi:MAG TPA: DHHA1 domain-containing protein [Flavitalea sp.]|nr:DHHA1 domain-containing protein [Flavitalea sp.]